MVRVGLVPVEGGADTRARFAPMRVHLNERLGIDVELVSASSYQGVITAMANGQLEFSMFGPKSYVEAAKRANAEALLIEISKEGEMGYRSIFIVPADSEVTTLEGARGLRFAFTDPNSTSGFLIPSTVLHDVIGEPAETYFGEVNFSGAHGTSILQVASGDIEIAATNDLDFARMVEKGAVQPDQVRVVYTSELIPGAPWAARRDIPQSLKDAFVEAVLEMNEMPEALDKFQIGGFERTSDERYDIIRATNKFLEQQQAKAP